MDDLGVVLNVKIRALESLEDEREAENVYEDCQKMVQEMRRIDRLQADEIVARLQKTMLHTRERIKKLWKQNPAIVRRRLFEKKESLNTVTGKQFTEGLAREEISGTNVQADNSDPAATLGREISKELRRMARQLGEGVEQADTSNNLLEKSTKRLAGAGDIHASRVLPVVQRTRRLVRALWSREDRDRWLVIFSIFLYIFALLYVLFQRILLFRMTIMTIFSILNVTRQRFMNLISYPFVR